MLFPILRNRVGRLVLLLAAACSGSGGPDGEHIADSLSSISRLVEYDGALYYVDRHVWNPDEGDSNAWVTRLPLAGGEPEVLYPAAGEGRLERIAVDDSGIYFLDPCITDTPHAATLPCSRLIRLPHGGGEETVLLEDELYDLALGTELVVLSRSDEAGTPGGAASGEIWLLDKAGGEPVVLVDGRHRLQDVALDEEAGMIYFVDTDPTDIMQWRISAISVDGGEPEVVGETPAGVFSLPIAAQDEAYLYLGGGAHIHVESEEVEDHQRRAYRLAKSGGAAEPVSPEREDGIGDLALFAGHVYLSDIGFRDGHYDPAPNGEVLSLEDGGGLDVVADGQEGPTALFVNQTHVYWTTASHGIWRIER